MTESLLELRELRKVFHVRRADGGGREELVAVDGVDLVVPVGGAVAIVGESGSGKSTCARLTVGLEQPTSGQILLGGREWSSGRVSARERRRRAGIAQMVFQDPYQSLDRRQQVRDCLDEALRLRGHGDAKRRSARIDELLDQVGLDERQAASLPKNLSGGQRQRVAIARALAAEPQLLILDEAVAALDVSIQAQVLNLLADIRASTGIAFLFISHDLAVVRQLCDDVVVMRHGRVVERGEATALLRDPQEEYTRRLVASIPRAGWTPMRRGGVAGIPEQHDEERP
ncbi:ABC transporter ATP-binding protein [Aeromicrobium endophyticum]|uniref:ABC transporter ATP-binding protein n=1 Tax=Aeromicrobium endophyticum TaxID=2292704 RepID=A0A371PCE8_9ACTN|nr:ATP-binding cassette domain-containing protein [Aeromicrobium endophyticum]REK73609.1 ABC transporter ATP-binding protein [Aeromicrobium endophyticum]